MTGPDSVPLRPVGVEPPHQHAHAQPYEAPYRWFIAASLVLGIGGGFMLSVLLPLARAYEWQWGAGVRWQFAPKSLAQFELETIGGGIGNVLSLGLQLRY